MHGRDEKCINILIRIFARKRKRCRQEHNIKMDVKVGCMRTGLSG
jgi:hypothetical protein